ncbi:MAG TPA: SDR family NAD(P)-dependent oxidoreductase, partial [Alicycliphilus sp.]|nr:SDR family NAD(P)-dependent oxidoreductase [Alicycliphilus sp.]
MDLGIEGKWALVCGASKGLGLGCAQALVGEGVNLVINARTPEALHASATQLIAFGEDAANARGQNGAKPQVLAVAADITTPEGRAAVFGVAGGPGTGFDIVVSNAGGPPTGDFRDWERAAWIRAVDANMLTPIELMRATVDGMAERGFGRVVNITSGAVKAPIDILGLSNGARSGLTG